MNHDVRIRAAKALLRVAKELSAASFSHPAVEIKSPAGQKVCVMDVRRLQLGGMRYPGEFVCVSGSYNEMHELNPILREEKFQWVREERVWAKYWKNCDWDVVQKRLSDAAMRQSTPDESLKPVENGGDFSFDLILSEVGELETSRYNPKVHLRMLKFVDVMGNTYRAWPDERRRRFPESDARFWSGDGNSFADDIDSLVGQMFTVSGRSKRTTVRGDHWDVYFEMK